MAAPILDEDEIIRYLKSPCNVEMINIIQSGAVQALMDMYDRETTRDEFLRMAAPCIALHSQCAKLWLLNNIHEVFKGGDLTDDRFVQAKEGLSDLIRKQTETVIESVKRLQLCPSDQDVVH